MIEMRTLIINGSPRRNGDTAYLIKKLTDKLEGKMETINCYTDNIKPCIDCRYCWRESGCIIKDDMAKVYADDYDNLVIATPIYNSSVTPPLFGLITRLNYIYANKRFLGVKHSFKEKKGASILVGGGDGEPDMANRLIASMFKKLNVQYQGNQIFSLNTDSVPVVQDVEALAKLEIVAQRLNEYNP